MMNRSVLVIISAAVIFLAGCTKSEEPAEGQAAPAPGTVEESTATSEPAVGTTTEQGGTTAPPASQ